MMVYYVEKGMYSELEHMWFGGQPGCIWAQHRHLRCPTLFQYHSHPFGFCCAVIGCWTVGVQALFTLSSVGQLNLASRRAGPICTWFQCLYKLVMLYHNDESTWLLILSCTLEQGNLYPPWVSPDLDILVMLLIWYFWSLVRWQLRCSVLRSSVPSYYPYKIGGESG